MQTQYECHGHIFMDGEDYRAAVQLHKNGPVEEVIRSHLRALQEQGVTYFRDGGDALGVSLLGKTIAPEYGITYRTPAFAIHRKGRYGGIVGRGYDSLREVPALVREARRQGADFIKYMFSGLLDFNHFAQLSCPPLPAEEIRQLVDIAHGEGMAVMAHVNGADTIRAAIEAGTDSIEHGYYMDDAALRSLAASDSIWVPTLAAIEAFGGRAGFTDEVVSQILRQQLENLSRAAAMGGKIAAGSDSGAVGVPHGGGILREYTLLSGILDAAQLESRNAELAARFIAR